LTPLKSHTTNSRSNDAGQSPALRSFFQAAIRQRSAGDLTRIAFPSKRIHRLFPVRSTRFQNQFAGILFIPVHQSIPFLEAGLCRVFQNISPHPKPVSFAPDQTVKIPFLPKCALPVQIEVDSTCRDRLPSANTPLKGPILSDTDQKVHMIRHHRHTFKIHVSTNVKS